MLLIKNLSTKIINGYIVSYGLFLCPFCLQEVIKKLSDGKKAKSCGCMSNKLRIQNIKDKKHTKEHNKKISEGHKGKTISEETKNKIKESNIGQKRTAVTIQNLSKSHIGKKMSEETKQKIKESCSGENHWNWQEGKSFEPYSPEFNKDLKNKIKQRDLNTCQTPNCMNNGCLDVHHIDYNKNNNNPENLITLCHSCHTKTNGKNNREYWLNYYSEIKNFYL